MSGPVTEAKGVPRSHALRARGGRALLACLFAVALLAGCYAYPIAPHPTVVYAPHPRHADESMDEDALTEMYTVSPDVNPEGLGAMDWVYDQSFITLVVWPIQLSRQERARIAYARTDQQHRETLAQRRFLYGDNLVFEGMWIGDFAELIDPSAYMPEGVYLLDDQGNRTVPFSVEALDPLTARSAYNVSEFGTAHVSFPFIVFPGTAITAQTKSISLYVALPDRRMRFTWVFDPEYVPPDGGGAGRPGHWSTR